MNYSKRNLVIDFSLIFDEDRKSLEEYLKGINRLILLQLSAFFLGFKVVDSQYKHYDDFLGMFFSLENEDFKKHISSKIHEIEKNKQTDLSIVNIESSLILFEYCYNNASEEQTQTNAESEINIFKAYLLINENTAKKEMVAFSSTDALPDEIKLSGIVLSQSMPYSDLINYHPAKVLIGQLIRVIFLFEYFELEETTKPLLEHFLKHYKVSNWKEYINMLLPTMMDVLKKKKEAQTTIIIDDEIHREFIDKLSIIDTTVIDGYDFIQIRNRPLLKLSDNEYLIIYSLFLLEKLYKSLYFKLNELNKELPSTIKIKEFKSYFGDFISEKIMLYKIMESIFEKKFIKYSGDEIKKHGFEAEPDYYLRNGNYIFLFESKDFLIRADVKRSYDYTLYEEKFKEKLFCEIENGKVAKKAILQLLNNVERILNNEFTFDQSYKEKNIYIYPIIIIHDYQYNLAGLNNIVNYWAKEGLGKLKSKGLNIDRVKPITIIDIDTIIFHQDILRSGAIKLNEMLDGYFKHITFDKTKTYKNEQHVSEKLQQTVIPFSLYIDRYVNERNLNKMPRMLRDKTMGLIEFV